MIQYRIMPKLVIDTIDLLDISEAAHQLRIGYATLYRWIKQEKIFPIRLSGRTLIPKSEIDRLNRISLKEKG